MQQTYDTNIKTSPERAIIVGVKFKSDSASDMKESLNELKQLVETAGMEIVCEMTQALKTPNPAYFIGRGKIEELKALMAELKAEAVIFNDDLTPGQTRNIEKTLDTIVIDRTGLILKIFDQRAQTKEARLQVDLAQLEYALPRLTRMWTHLSRQSTGGGGGGAGRAFRDAGETQIQLDRRMIRGQIARVKKDLQEVEKRRRVRRRNRKEMTNVSLVGYTNAGKSTLFNALTGENRLVEDKLFATLDSTTRIVDLPSNQQILLSDTVGFIRKLPHHLVSAFKATLEEITEADLLLHVIDISHPQAEEQIDAVNQVLEELNATDLPTIMVFNKIDLIESETELQLLNHKYPNSVAISALDGNGLDVLKAKLAERFAERDIDISLNIPYIEGKTLDFLYKHGEVLDTDYQADGIQVNARIPRRHLKSVKPFMSDDANSLNTGIKEIRELP